MLYYEGYPAELTQEEWVVIKDLMEKCKDTSAPLDERVAAGEEVVIRLSRTGKTFFQENVGYQSVTLGELMDKDEQVPDEVKFLAGCAQINHYIGNTPSFLEVLLKILESPAGTTDERIGLVTRQVKGIHEDNLWSLAYLCADEENLLIIRLVGAIILAELSAINHIGFLARLTLEVHEEIEHLTEDQIRIEVDPQKIPDIFRRSGLFLLKDRIAKTERKEPESIPEDLRREKDELRQKYNGAIKKLTGGEKTALKPPSKRLIP